MKNSSFVYVIPFSDFERICSTIYTIVQSEGDDLRQSCVFVNIAGAMILNEHYKIKAKVCAGAALYRLSETRNLEFRDKNDEFVVGSQEGFHCWIDTGEWFIDFTSPMYPEMLKLAGSTESCGKKMFQKTHEQMSESPNDVHQNNQGIVAEVDQYPYSDVIEILERAKGELPFVLMLDSLQDPQNFGTLIRPANP